MNSKKIGRNDPCPCGSGKKYKKCCLQNDKAYSINNEDIPNFSCFENQIRKKFSYKTCLHPDAPQGCEGRIVDAHSIQKKGSLENIIDSSNHVYSFFPQKFDSNGELIIQRRGWKSA